MRYLKTNTATIVTVGPFLDKTDGVTLETGLTITNERISFTVDMNDGSAPTLVLDNVTGATSGTSNDLNYISGNDAGLMQLELAAANVNYLGRAFLTITDAANHCPVFHEFMILPAMVFDSLIAGTDVLQADMTQILGTAVSAPATAGILDVNLKNIANAAVATTSAQLGVNLVNVAGSAVSTSTAQIGVNAVNAGGTAWGSGAITANSIATGAITNAKFAAGAIDAAAVATGAIDADAIADNAIDAGAIATGAITNAKFAAGAIDAEAIANNAIDAATFAADVDAEVAAYIWNAAIASYGTAGTYGALIESGNVGGGSIIAASVTGAVGSVTGLTASDVGAIKSAIGTPVDLGNGTATVAGNLQDIDTETDTILGYVSNIATTGSPSYAAPSSNTLTTGSQTSGTYANVDTANSVYHQLADAAGTLSNTYHFTLRPDEEANSLTFKGRWNGSNDTLTIAIYDWAAPGWVTVFSSAGIVGSTDTTTEWKLVGKYTGSTGADVGKVDVRFSGTGLTSCALYVDQLIVGKTSTSRTVGYSQGAIWIDSANGSAGTTAYYNGTADHPVAAWADALTLAAALGFYRFNIAPGTQITASANCKKYALAGKGWKLDMAGYDFSHATIDGCEYLTGAALAADWEVFIWNSQLGAVTLGEADLHNCHITDTVTLSAAAPYLFNRCVGVPIATPTIDFGAAVGGSAVVCGGWSGMLTVKNMKAGDTLVIDGQCDLTLDATCVAGTVYMAGNIRLTNSGSGQTFYQDSRTSAEDRMRLLLDATPTAAVVDDNDPDPTATAFETTLTEASNDHYNGAFLVFSSGALTGQSRKISDYDGTNKIITVATAFTEAPAAGDTFMILGRSE